ncbi:MAG: hypothetical protein IT285_12875, partial [Bdellovibrionales bacterium]|nr:hypothetical protein [Bdellovibrionales bacterium]
MGSWSPERVWTSAVIAGVAAAASGCLELKSPASATVEGGSPGDEIVYFGALGRGASGWRAPNRMA